MRSGAAVGGVVLAGVLGVSLCVSALVASMDANQQPPAALQGSCGTGSLAIPERARPWIKKAAEVSGLPEPYLAAIAKQESDFDPNNFTPDSNGGTWGLFQINRAEWHEHYPQGDNPGGTPKGITDPMLHAEIGGRYLKARLEYVRKLQKANPSTEWGKLKDLDALVIAHNAGEGNLQRYPAIPSITRGYLANVNKWFRATPCPDGGGVGSPVGVKPASGKLVSPIPPGTTGVVMTAGYFRYPRGGVHWGVDLAKNGKWTPVSICDGTVVQVRINAAYANRNALGVSGSTNYVWIDCGNNVWMGYAHFYAQDLNPALKVGVKVGAGTPLFPQGNQGNSSGGHLHLQISTSGSTAYSQAATVNPTTYLAGLGIQLPALGRG